MVGRDVAGDDSERMHKAALGDRDANRTWDGDGATYAGDYLAGYTGLGAGLELFESTSEYIAITALEPNDALTGARMFDHQLIDLFLGHLAAIGQLGGVDNFLAFEVAQTIEFAGRAEMVRQNNVGVL